MHLVKNLVKTDWYITLLMQDGNFIDLYDFSRPFRGTLEQLKTYEYILLEKLEKNCVPVQKILAEEIRWDAAS